ncbi:hypothetical protein Ciccas_003542 [Cichlidogyrus casuarinus]|uniref:Uncharacterized protein n=1 Tax=Cichlidogyrus casuarinus TaxID=1844966 RepID=A0ABD2QEU5_9PLAT
MSDDLRRQKKAKLFKFLRIIAEGTFNPYLYSSAHHGVTAIFILTFYFRLQLESVYYQVVNNASHRPLDRLSEAFKKADGVTLNKSDPSMGTGKRYTQAFLELLLVQLFKENPGIPEETRNKALRQLAKYESTRPSQ